MAGLGLLGLQWSGVTTTLRCLCGTSIAADAGQGIADVHDRAWVSWRACLSRSGWWRQRWR